MDLKTVLHETAQDMPPASTDGLWERGQLVRRHRRFRIVAVVLLLLASVVLAPRLFAGPELPIGADPGRPGTLGKPYWWQQSFSQNPNGPAAALFFHGGTYTGESAGVVVGLDGSYRLIELDPGEALGLVSPDGRYLAHGGRLIDLKTGRWIKLAPDADESVLVFPLAWSADSKQLSFAVDLDELAPGTAPGTDEVRVFTLGVATSRTMHLTSTDPLTTAAAFSPDGRLMALSTTGDLILIDVEHGSTSEHIPLEPDQKLAGQAAWTPDGKRIALTIDDTCRSQHCPDPESELDNWHLLFLDPGTGKVEIGGRRRGTPEVLAGWRNDEPVFSGYLNGGNSLFVAKPDGSAEVLLAFAEGGGGLDVPRDRVERANFTGDVRANPLAAQPWAYVCVLLSLVLIGLPIAWIWRRRVRTVRPMTRFMSR